MRRSLIHMGMGQGILSYPPIPAPIAILKARTHKQWSNDFCQDLLDLKIPSWPLLKDTVLALDCSSTPIRSVFNIVQVHYFPVFCEICYMQIADGSRTCTTMSSVFAKLFKKGKEIRQSAMTMKDPVQALPLTKKIIDYSDVQEYVKRLNVELSGFPEEDLGRVKAGFGAAVQRTHQDRTGVPNYVEMTKIVEARNILQKRIELFLK